MRDIRKKLLGLGMILVFSMGVTPVYARQTMDVVRENAPSVFSPAPELVTYSNGSTITIDDFPKETFLKYRGAYVLRDESLARKTLVQMFTDDYFASYNVLDKTKSFVTTAGETFNSEEGTYTHVVDIEKEIDALCEQFKEGRTDLCRYPVATTSCGYLESGTYIEVSIDEQHLWYYENGTLIIESDIVTGTKGRCDTPTGFYYIDWRKDGKYLTGPGYRVWVDEWMHCIPDNIGLHDASWRDSFGGEIYNEDGSHGCINLPPKFAAELYDCTNVGTPVVVY